MKKVSIFLVMSLLSFQVAVQSSDELSSFQRKQWNDVASLEDTWNVKNEDLTTIERKMIPVILTAKCCNDRLLRSKCFWGGVSSFSGGLLAGNSKSPGTEDLLHVMNKAVDQDEASILSAKSTEEFLTNKNRYYKSIGQGQLQDTFKKQWCKEQITQEINNLNSNISSEQYNRSAGIKTIGLYSVLVLSSLHYFYPKKS